MKRLQKFLCLLMVCAAIFSFTAAAESFSISRETYVANALANFISQYYKFDVDTNAVYVKALDAVLEQHPEMLETVLKSMTETLDDYSYYLTAEEYGALLLDIDGEFVGIGVTIEERMGYVTVISPIEGSPAEKAGLLPGDKLSEVDGTSVVEKGIEFTRSLIVGERGTNVKIGVLREGCEETLYFDVTRDIIEQASVAYGLFEEDGIGYIKISQFTTSTPAELQKALDEFDAKGIKKLIIDVRNNPGGEKNSVIEVLGKFVPEGPVMHVEYKNSAMDEIYYSYNKNPGKYDIAVLTNEYSASAAEAFSGTMQDTKSAVLVGETTFGKGTVQTIHPISTGGAIKLTVATYTTANKNPINKIGVTPDYEIKNKVVPLSENPDIPSMQYDLEINAQSSEEAIKAVQYRLSALNMYFGEADGTYSEALTKATAAFQTSCGMEPTGVMDIMTQVNLANSTANIETLIDNQLETAVKVLNGTIDKTE